MTERRRAQPHGRLRQSQIVTTFGPGALLDLPAHAVIIGGLEGWGDPTGPGFRPIRDDRLLAKVARVLERDDLRLYTPPIDLGENEPKTGIAVWRFPRWFVAQYEEVRRAGTRSRRLLFEMDLVKGKYETADKKKHGVVPVRFVQACVNGHVSDIDWRGWVHDFTNDCRRSLWFEETGTTGDLADIAVSCECGATRSLARALAHTEDPLPLGACRGERPWLGKHAREDCLSPDGKFVPNRLLVRHATNAYFPQVMSVISLPESDERVRQAVELIWEDYLQYVEDLAELKRDRAKKVKIANALEGFSDESAWAEIQRRKTPPSHADKSIKQAEIETLLAQREAVGDDVPELDFYATALPVENGDRPPLSKVQRIVLVHRLREVTAQVGFTRFEAALPDIDGELSLGVRRAALAREAAWVPAIENRGEGFLVSFSVEEIMGWLKRPTVARRVDQLEAGFKAWDRTHSKMKAKFPGGAYVLLHSLSHLLINAVSLACGYSASAIRERIYVTPAGCGILLFTGTPDAEGTLGGLVEVARDLGAHLRASLEYGVLCSNDPICAQHQPDNPQEERFLHGAACHGCLLIAEPSCERRNEYLDRALVVPTVTGLGAEFFGEDELA